MKAKSEIIKSCKTLLSSVGIKGYTEDLSSKATRILYGASIVPGSREKSPWVSVEIECFFKNSKVCWDLIAAGMAKADLSSFVRIKEDGSINPDSYKYASAEIVVSAPESKILVVLERVCCVLNSFNSSTNSSCGLHIHIDHRPVTKRSPLISYNNLFYAEDIFYKVSKPHRRNCEFCVPVSKNNDVFTSLASVYDDCDDRYKSINAQAMQDHSTLEVRVFHGTTSFDEIKHFVNLVLGVVNSRLPIKSVVNLKNLDSHKSIPLCTRKFIKSKFRKPSKKKISKRKAA